MGRFFAIKVNESGADTNDGNFHYIYANADQLSFRFENLRMCTTQGMGTGYTGNPITEFESANSTGSKTTIDNSNLDPVKFTLSASMPDSDITDVIQTCKMIEAADGAASVGDTDGQLMIGAQSSEPIYNGGASNYFAQIQNAGGGSNAIFYCDYQFGTFADDVVALDSVFKFKLHGGIENTSANEEELMHNGSLSFYERVGGDGIDGTTPLSIIASFTDIVKEHNAYAYASDDDATEVVNTIAQNENPSDDLLRPTAAVMEVLDVNPGGGGHTMVFQGSTIDKKYYQNGNVDPESSEAGTDFTDDKIFIHFDDVS